MGQTHLSEIGFRPATRSDLTAVLEISRQTFDEHLERQPEIFTEKSADNLARELRQYFSTQSNGTTQLYVVEEDGVVLGHVYVRIQPWQHGEDREDMLALISDISFRPDRRGMGLGKRALAYVEEQLRSEGVTKIAATVWRDNIASDAMFSSEGFVRDTTIFGKRLAPAGPRPKLGRATRAWRWMKANFNSTFWLLVAAVWIFLLVQRLLG